MNIPCYLICGTISPKAKAPHYHCSVCKSVSVDAEEHVVHSVSCHEYSLVYAEEMDRLLKVCEAATERLHAEQQQMTASNSSATAKEAAAGESEPEIGNYEVRCSRNCQIARSSKFWRETVELPGTHVPLTSYIIN